MTGTFTGKGEVKPNTLAGSAYSAHKTGHPHHLESANEATQQDSDRFLSTLLLTPSSFVTKRLGGRQTFLAIILVSTITIVTVCFLNGGFDLICNTAYNPKIVSAANLKWEDVSSVTPAACDETESDYSSGCHGNEDAKDDGDEEMEKAEEIAEEKQWAVEELVPWDFIEKQAKRANGSDMMRMRLPQFLANYRNPCWREELGDKNPYRETYYMHGGRSVNYLMKRFDARIKRGTKWRIRCLPYFYLAGQPKCGTTDLYSKIVAHPQIADPTFKEPHWWTRRRFGGVPFNTYLDVFDIAAEKIRRNKDAKGVHPMITGEGSASTFWDFDHWPELENTTGKGEPNIMTPQYLRRLFPATKIILILRNPTTRLYSDYLYFRNNDKTPETFHKRVITSIKLMNQCIQNRTVRACVYDTALNHNHIQVRLRIGMYYVYLRDWLRVFPMQQIHILQLEDYSQNLKEKLKGVYRFLDLDDTTEEVLDSIVELPHANVRRPQDKKVGPMLNETRQALNNFYRVYNIELSTLLGDKKFMWDS